MFYSIIVPVYNSERVLERCIKSILGQSFKDYELILVDDGSEDKSGSICDRFATEDNRVQVLHKKNGGVSSARNKGIEVSQGEFIVFIDADDYIEQDYLLHLKDHCTSGSIALGGYVVKNESLSIIRTRTHQAGSVRITNQQVVADYFVSMDFDCVWGKAFCREDIVSNDVVFDVKMNYGEDSKFVIDMLQHIEQIQLVPFSEYCHIKYSTATLSTFSSFENAIDRIELESSMVCSSLRSVVGSIAEECVIKKSGEKYANLFLSAVSQRAANKKLVLYFYKHRWFRKVLDAADTYFPYESAKFKWLLKTKSPTLMSLYLNVKN